ncbi:MAG: LPP20 family lipoprotein, partial [Nitrospiraceae bacterium]
MLRTRAVQILLLGVVAGFLNGCVRFGHGPEPSWIEGVSREYPPDQYLLGVGQAESRPAAAERAYAAVAKIFKAQISAQSRDWESYMVLENRGKASAERRVTLDQLTSVSTDKVLENVRIMDTWFEARNGQHYAMAGMDRAQAATAVLERIAALDGIVETQLKESRQTQDKLARVRNLRRAVKNLVVREAYNADLRVIRTTGRGVDPAYRVGELTAELE